MHSSLNNCDRLSSKPTQASRSVWMPALMPHALQVGSKNAAFFMGKCIKIATRSAGSSFVHELGIAAADLEERYKAHEASPCLLMVPSSLHDAMCHQRVEAVRSI